jgi:hypothetical protein
MQHSIALAALGALAACSSSPDPQPDASPAPTTCRHFGPLVSQGTVGRAGGAPLSASGTESDPWVMRDGGRLRMWFTTATRTPPANLRTAYAESDDGVIWRDVHDAVLQGTPGTFDGNGVETVAVVKTDGDYTLLYTGDEPPEGSNRFAIGLATSPDGIAFTKPSTAPALPPVQSWELPFCDDDACTNMVGGTLEPSLVRDAGGTYHLWYAALGAIGVIPSFRIGHASSRDARTWTRTPDPVFTAGPAGAWDEVLVSHTNVVADPGGGYHLFYFGSSIADDAKCQAEPFGCLLTPGSIGHAFSDDGIVWTRDPDPVLSPSGFGAWSVGGPSALIEDGTLKLWYFGTPTATSLDLRIGLATARCGDG